MLAGSNPMGTIGSLPGGKAPRYQADLCTVFRIRMSGALLLCPLHIFMMLCLNTGATLPIKFSAICFNKALVHDRENIHILKLRT